MSFNGHWYECTVIIIISELARGKIPFPYYNNLLDKKTDTNSYSMFIAWLRYFVSLKWNNFNMYSLTKQSDRNGFAHKTAVWRTSTTGTTLRQLQRISTSATQRSAGSRQNSEGVMAIWSSRWQTTRSASNTAPIKPPMWRSWKSWTISSWGIWLQNLYEKYIALELGNFADFVLGWLELLVFNLERMLHNCVWNFPHPMNKSYFYLEKHVHLK